MIRFRFFYYDLNFEFHSGPSCSTQSAIRLDYTLTEYSRVRVKRGGQLLKRGPKLTHMVPVVILTDLVRNAYLYIQYNIAT